MSDIPSQDSDSCAEYVPRANTESDDAYTDADDQKIDVSCLSLEEYQVPPCWIPNRIKALKKLQLEYMHIEEKLFLEVHELVARFNQMYSRLYKERRDIITGEKEPTVAECEFNLDGPEGDEAPWFSPNADVCLNVKGVPHFWLTVLKNVPPIKAMIQPHDEPILKHLIDIQVDFLVDPMGFRLTFVFAPNEYFSEQFVTKTYELRNKVDDSNPFGYQGPEITRCKGCFIDWRVDKNVTQKIIVQRQKHRNFGMRNVTKKVKADSFFNFFLPPQVLDERDLDEETRAYLRDDFAVGVFIKERVVPRAVLYFTGEAVKNERVAEQEEEDDDEFTDASDGTESAVAFSNPETAEQTPANEYMSNTYAV